MLLSHHSLKLPHHCLEFTPKILTYPSLSLAIPSTVVFSQVPLTNINPPLLIQLVVPDFLLNKHDPLHLPQPLSVMPQDYLNLLPRFNGEDGNNAQRHIKTFCASTEDLNVEQLDVVVRLFVQSLDGETRKWFKSLPDASIATWEKLENSFTQKWDEKRNHEYVLTQFNVIRKKPEEDISKFIKSFNKQYNNLLGEIKPPQATAHVLFVGAFESNFGFTLRERKSRTLYQLQVDALEVEENFTLVGKSRGKDEPIEKKREKEETSSFGQAKGSPNLKWE